MVTLSKAPQEPANAASARKSLPPLPKIDLTEFPRRDHLRVETADDLALLEAAPRMLGLMGPGLTLDSYADVLGRLYGFYRGMEPWLQKALEPRAEALVMARRWRGVVLSQDLLALGTPHDVVGALPACPAPPIPPRLPEGLGVQFAFECVARNAPVVGRHLTAALRIQPTGGGGFFAGYGADGPALWTWFAAVLEQDLAEEAAMASAVTSARNAFLALERWLSLPDREIQKFAGAPKRERAPAPAPEGPENEDGPAQTSGA